MTKHVIGTIFGGKRVLYAEDVGRNYGSGTGNNKSTRHPYSGPREEARARKRLAQMQRASSAEDAEGGAPKPSDTILSSRSADPTRKQR